MKGIETLNFFLLRSPSLPVRTVYKLDSLTTYDELSSAIKNLFKDRETYDSIFYASEELSERVGEWLRSETSSYDEKLLITLYKYLSRMSTRSTPFGMFAGISLGEISGNASSIVLSGNTVDKIRIDHELVAQIVTFVLEDENFLNDTFFTLNNSLFEEDGHIRFVEHKLLEGRRSYLWVKVEKNPLIEIVLTLAGSKVTFGSLINELTMLGMGKENAKEYVKALIRNQILVSELEPTVTGDRFFEFLSVRLNRSKSELHAKIKEIIELLSRNVRPKATDRRFLRDIVSRNNGGKVKHTFQLDRKLVTLRNHLNSSVVQTVQGELFELMPFFRVSQPKDLLNFKKSFLERYDRQELPLLEVMAADAGIGYGDQTARYRECNPLIEGLKVGHRNVSDRKTYPHKILAHFFRKAYSIGTAIDLEELLEDEPGLGGSDWVVPPPTFYCMGSFIAKDAFSLDKGNFKFELSVCSGPSALNLFGRFGHLEQELASKLKECAEFEASCFPDAVLAEIVHVPEDRMANIIQRPQMHAYEIPFLGKPSVEDAFQIPIVDLLVSVRNDKVVLRSKRLGKRVLPRLSCAHNYKRGNSIYRFLADLQHQDFPFSLKWEWDELNSSPFLPRVVYKHLILSRARWYIKNPPSISEKGRMDWIAYIRRESALPQRVLLAEGDNELHIDLDTLWGKAILLDKLKKGNVVLYESLHDLQHGVVVTIGSDVFNNEVIIPFMNKKDYFPSNDKVGDQMGNGIALKRQHRSFALGSEWIYLKLYCGQKWADSLLCDIIRPMIDELRKEGLIEKFFFVRYNDPDFHIRLRFLSKPYKASAFVAQVIGAVNAFCGNSVINGTIYRVQYDTYEREIERYGAKNMECSESIFHVDSMAVMEILKACGGQEDIKALYATALIDQIFEAFGIDIVQRQELTSSWSDSFRMEFSIGSESLFLLDQRYRKWRKSVSEILNGIHPSIKEFENTLKMRKDMLHKCAQGYIHSETNDLFTLLANISHMSMNRLFFSEQRMNEMMIYFFLSKHYRSEIAIRKQKVTERVIT